MTRKIIHRIEITAPGGKDVGTLTLTVEPDNPEKHPEIDRLIETLHYAFREGRTVSIKVGQGGEIHELNNVGVRSYTVTAQG